ncbi:MAG: NUDIX domain-containing protein [Streptosporangiaceae bacterium]
MSDSPDHWTCCSQGHIHWGPNGGAGLLLRYVPGSGEPMYLLALRAGWVDEGGTWGIPGGAIQDGEAAEEAAQREAAEEIWPLPPYRIAGVDVQDCGGGWQYHIMHGDVLDPFLAYAASETEATGWFTLAEMDGLPLHPGFQKWVEENAPLDG